MLRIIYWGYSPKKIKQPYATSEINIHNNRKQISFGY